MHQWPPPRYEHEDFEAGVVSYTRSVQEIQTQDFLFARIDDVAGVNIIVITAMDGEASQAFVYDDVLIGENGYFSPADLAWGECQQYAADLRAAEKNQQS
jgi:hypothetical protein